MLQQWICAPNITVPLYHLQTAIKRFCHVLSHHIPLGNIYTKFPLISENTSWNIWIQTKCAMKADLDRFKSKFLGFRPLITELDRSWCLRIKHEKWYRERRIQGLPEIRNLTYTVYKKHFEWRIWLNGHSPKIQTKNNLLCNPLGAKGFSPVEIYREKRGYFGVMLMFGNFGFCNLVIQGKAVLFIMVFWIEKPVIHCTKR